MNTRFPALLVVMTTLFGLLVLVPTTIPSMAQDAAPPPLLVEAESGTIGGEFATLSEDSASYISITTNFNETTGDAGFPGAGRTASYVVTFPEAGTYALYVRLRVGPGAFDDDSFFYGIGFGEAHDPTNPDAWTLVNGLAGVGYADAGAYVESAGTLGSEVWKWLRLTSYDVTSEPGDPFVVAAGALTQVFEIGAREDGLDIDKFAFAPLDAFYTVENLDNGEPGVFEIPDIENTLRVDLSDILRPVTHAASGALYGVTETLPANLEEMVAPLKPYVYVQPALSGAGHQQPFGAAIPVSARLASTTGQVAIRLADISPNWPYIWPGEASWVSQVTGVINDKIASGRDNYYGYEIWNEQHGTWDTANGEFFSTLWKPTCDLIRSLDPEAAIIGPSDSFYSRSRIEEFLTFCIQNDCLPDIISWHELGGSDNVSSNIDSYRSLESSLGIAPREISINEYSHTTREYEGAPGISAPFIAKFERKLVHSASISWWFVNLPGRLGSLLTASNERGGGWWFYKWYGDMTGDMVRVTPPSESGDGIDGFANLDMDAAYASIGLGGDHMGNVDVVISGIPASFGDEVDVQVEYVPWSNKDTPVAGPVTVSLTTYEVAEGSITVPVDIADPLYGYRVYVAPVGQIVATEALPEGLAGDFALGQNYPNPFQQETKIPYRLPASTRVQLEVFNMIGQKVAVLVDEVQAEGMHTVTFDAATLPSGLYMYRLQVGERRLMNKMVVLR